MKGVIKNMKEQFLNLSGLTELVSYIKLCIAQHKTIISRSSFNLFPETGDENNIYIDTSTNAIYRWNSSGKTYILLAKPPRTIVISEGQNNGEITLKIDNSTQNAYVHGLKSAAFTESNSYATAAQGAKADSAVQTITLAPGTNNGTVKLTVNNITTDNIEVAGLGSAAFSDIGIFAPKEHTHTKAQVGLGNVDNTADYEKHVNFSIYTQLLAPAYDGLQTFASTWKNEVTEGTVVWGQAWKDPTLSNDTGDLSIWIKQVGDALTANMTIDGTITAVSGFIGPLIGNADSATYAYGVDWDNIKSKPSVYPPPQDFYDERFYLKNEVDSKLSGKSDTGHTHVQFIQETKFSNGTYTDPLNGTAAAIKASGGIAADLIYEGGTLLSNKYQAKGDYAPSNHTHNYAGSDSSGGVAYNALNIYSAEPILSTGSENNEITVKTNPNEKFTSLGINSIRSALDFRWYDTHWQIGNIRGSSTDSIGFGIVYSSNGEDYSNCVYIDTSAVIHGNLAGNASSASSVPWSGVQDKPSTFTPSDHGHTISDITALQATLDSKFSVNGGTLNGPLKWNSSSLPQVDGSPRFLLGIDAFDDGGTTKWQGVSAIRVGAADRADIATFATCPSGFSTQATTQTWGNQDGTFLTDWHTANGGDISFRDNGGTINVIIDGSYYQNEGRYKVLDENNYTSYALSRNGGSMDGTAWFTWRDSGNWNNNNEGVTFPVKRGGLQWVGQSDYVRLYAEETGSDNLELFLEFLDDNSNGLSIRNASGTTTARIAADGTITGYLNGTAANANTLGGYGGSMTSSSLSYVLRDGNNYSWFYYIHSDTSNNENPVISQIITTNGSDGFYRKSSLEHLKNSLGYMPPINGSQYYVRVFNSANINANSEYTFNDFAKQHYAMGMIYAAEDNPCGTANWLQAINLGWRDGSNAEWVSQIAIGVQNGTGLYYRTTAGGDSIVGRSWNTVLDSANFMNYALPWSGGTMRGPLNLANSTWNIAGDDSAFGDHDIAGTFCIKGLNGTPGIRLFNSDDSYYADVLTSANYGSYALSINGGIVYGTINSKGHDGNYNENIRIHPSPSKWTSIVMCGDDNTGDSGTSKKTWGIFTYDGIFTIAKNGSLSSNSSASLTCESDNYWRVNNNIIIDTGNIGEQSVNYANGANVANYINIVASNEVRFSNKPSNAIDLHIGYAWSDGSKDALISSYRFCNGNGTYAQIAASQFISNAYGNILTIGSLNESYAHFQNSANIPFYFNKTVYIDGDLLPYGSSSTKNLGNSGNYWKDLYASIIHGTLDGSASMLDGCHSYDFFRYSGWWTSNSGQNVNDATGMIFAYSDHGLPGAWGTVATFEYTINSGYKLQIYGDGANNTLYYRNRSVDMGGWLDWHTIIDSANIGSQSVNYANSAFKSNYTDYINVTHGNEIRFNKPSYDSATLLHFGWAWADGSQTKLISEYRFDGGDGNLTQVAASQFNGPLNGTATNSEYVANDSQYMRFHWSGQGGQPTWLWGGNEAENMYVYNPSNFSVNYANSSGSSNWLNTNSSLNYGASGLQYFNQSTSTTSGAGNNANPSNDWYHIIRMNHANGAGYYVDLAFCFHSNTVAYRRIVAGTEYTWTYLIDSSNIGNQSVNYSNSTGYVHWNNVDGRPYSLPASDVYAWAKAATKPSYSWGEINDKPSTFTPASHTHSYLPLTGGTLDNRSTSTPLILRGRANNETSISFRYGDANTGHWVMGLGCGTADINTFAIYKNGTGVVARLNSDGQWRCARQNYSNVYTGNIWPDPSACTISFSGGTAWGISKSPNALAFLNASSVKFRMQDTYCYCDVGFQSEGINSTTTSGGSNVRIENSILKRASSASKYKLNIENIQKEDTYAYNLLRLNPKQWFDKGDIERYSEYLSAEYSGKEVSEEFKSLVDSGSLDPHYGLIAEDVEAAGLEKFCDYGKEDENGKKEIEGIQYDRLPVLMIPILRDLVTCMQKILPSVKNSISDPTLLSEVKEIESRFNSFNPQDIINKQYTN